MLIDNDFAGVKDEELASWIKTAQGAGEPRFSLICTFVQCFGGGFLHELKTQAVPWFGANSASKYFEPATYCEVAGNPANGRSYYAWAWKMAAGPPAPPHPDDRAITDDAYNNRVPANIQDLQHAQYQNCCPHGPPPEPLHCKAHNYAILFSGMPGVMDQQDVSDIYAVLNGAAPGGYGYPAEDICILYGDGTTPGGVAWTVNEAATGTNLHDVLTGPALPGHWRLQKKLADIPGPTQVFFWAGDHGGVDAPISLSVDEISVGLPGSEVAARVAVGNRPESMVYEAGRGTNIAGWDLLGAILPDPFPPSRDIDAISFGTDRIPPDGIQSYYFSVDRTSVGRPGSGVQLQQAAGGGKSAAPDVFVVAAGTNHQMFDGVLTLGLREVRVLPPPPAPPVDDSDELNALSFVPIAAVVDAEGNLRVPLFFSVKGSPDIYVYDPTMPPAARIYRYFDWAGVPAPTELDALALRDDFVRRPLGHPDAGKLFFDPGAKPVGDAFLFSVGRGEAAVPCEIYKASAAGIMREATCAQLGLLDTDNVDALDTYDGTGPNARAGDLDGDGDVDGDDFRAFLATFGLKAVDDGFNPRADLDHDGGITLIDYQQWLMCWWRFRQAVQPAVHPCTRGEDAVRDASLERDY